MSTKPAYDFSYDIPWSMAKIGGEHGVGILLDPDAHEDDCPLAEYSFETWQDTDDGEIIYVIGILSAVYTYNYGFTTKAARAAWLEERAEIERANGYDFIEAEIPARLLG